MVLRWGICGAGLISSDFVSSVLAPPSNVHEVVCIGARSMEKAQKFADKFGIKKAYGSYEEVGNDPDVDIVYIGVIHTFHVAVSKQMLKAGKNVLCEKPMAANLAQVLEVQQVARECKKFFMEAVWSRCFPVYRKIKEEVRSGNLGEIQHVEVQFCFPINKVDRIAKPELGGGGLHDLGVYPIQLAAMIYNNEKPQKITADGTLSDLGVDQDGCITLTYKNGGRAVLTYSTLFTGKNQATIYGSKGVIKLEETFWCPREATLPSGKVSNEIPTGPVPYNFPNGGGLRFEADCVKECLEAGKLECSEVSFADSQALYHIIDEVVKQYGMNVKW
ncbi:trans-1,2-dihydrobenzene-1,2-diol dehydrogenase-like isoform X2 [Ostrea edulis]|uniref:trans-1,2-dihydrobenzene-1,2-diol dehydrogenase-like isoform X2 n=1 Tax=Ostrea edulis TaxID=37623 RepID=UPI0024AEDFA2|nr:trans-1,2-dihydrobenzene-1,2-diol dehydrogenase-like isoform X2 [Ostrea edulis]